MKNSYKIQWLVWSSLSVFRRGKGKVSKEWSVLPSTFRSDAFPAHTQSGTTNLRAVFLKVWPVAHLHQNHQKCSLSSKIPRISLRRLRDLSLQLALQGSDASKVWEARPERLRAANHPHPQGSLPGTGVHWSSGGLVPASQPWGRVTGPNSFGQAGGLTWVSTGASRPACAQPSQGRPWSPWMLPCVLVGVGAVVESAHRRRRRCYNHWSQPTLGTAASAWCRSTGCQDWRLHRVVRLG